MIENRFLYTIECDQCGYCFCGNHIYAFNTSEEAISFAKDDGWLIKKGTVLCEDCVLEETEDALNPF